MAKFRIAHNKYFSCACADGWRAADFKPAQELVKKSEGGYTNNPSDNGNWTGGVVGAGELIGTNWGISAPTLVAELKRLGGAKPTASTMKNLQYASAAAIYKRMFWDKIKGDDIKNQNIANTIYDAYVNQSGWTRLMIADTLKNIGKPTDVKVPLKAEVVEVINSVSPEEFYREFNKQRKKAYEITAARPNQGQFLKGWMNRLSTFDGVMGAVKANQGKTALVILGIGAVATGIYFYTKNK